MSKMINGSIDLTKIGEAVRAGHSAVYTSANGTKYLNITVQVNDEPNEYGQRGSVQIWDKHSNKKEYLGNFGLYEEQNAVRKGQSNSATKQEENDFPI